MAIQDQVGRMFEKRSNGAWNLKSGVTLGTRREAIETSAAALTLTENQSGAVVIANLGSGTQTFTLPAAAAGLTFTFLCNHASGEILINTATGDVINIMTFGAVGADADTARVAPTTGTGIKNTAATNVVGDSVTLIAADTTTWYSQGITVGIWASQ
jgi:hypothetical protein